MACFYFALSTYQSFFHEGFKESLKNLALLRIVFSTQQFNIYQPLILILKYNSEHVIVFNRGPGWPPLSFKYHVRHLFRRIFFFLKINRVFHTSLSDANINRLLRQNRIQKFHQIPVYCPHNSVIIHMKMYYILTKKIHRILQRRIYYFISIECETFIYLNRIRET